MANTENNDRTLRLAKAIAAIIAGGGILGFIMWLVFDSPVANIVLWSVSITLGVLAAFGLFKYGAFEFMFDLKARVVEKVDELKAEAVAPAPAPVQPKPTEGKPSKGKSRKKGKKKPKPQKPEAPKSE